MRISLPEARELALQQLRDARDELRREREEEERFRNEITAAFERVERENTG